MRRSSFLVGAANLAAAGGLLTLGAAANSEEIGLERFRAGDYAATPYARVIANGGSNFAAPVSEALAAIRAGANPESTATFFSAGAMTARLYTVRVDRFPFVLLLVGTADGLTDVGAFPDPGTPQSGDSGIVWAVYDALSLALWTVWPTSESESSLSVTRYSGQRTLSFQAARARWAQENDAAQAHILATLASAAARLDGLIEPNTAGSTISIAVRSADVTQATGTPAFPTAQQQRGTAAYLAHTTTGLRRWLASPPGA